MHELALARSIVELIEEQARTEAFSRVLCVRLCIGALSTVDPRALAFGFDAAARGTVAEGARLAFDRPGAQAWCTDCSAAVEVASYGDPCPRCGGHRWLVTRGQEARVVDLEVE